MTDSEDAYNVHLYVYDLSRGIAARYSPLLIGKKVDGIWHTGIVVYNREYYFGSGGVNVTLPGSSVVGEPLEKVLLGQTHVPPPVFQDYIAALNESEFSGSTYNLISHNCNNFSDTVSHFLVGKGIPSYILDLPSEILNTPFGHTYRLLIDQISAKSPNLSSLSFNRSSSPEFQQLNSEIEAARERSASLKEQRNALSEKLAKSERKKNKRAKKEAKRRGSKTNGYVMSESNGTMVDEGGEQPAPARDMSGLADELAEEERREREERRKNREPPIVFKDAVDVHIEFDKLVGLIDGKLTEDEQQSLEELHQYMLQDEGSWALGDGFLTFVERLLTDKTLGDEVSVRCLNVLAAAALKDDVILMLHQDRKQHILMNYAQEVDRLPLPQQKALTLFMCNLFENSSSAEWLLYISEWAYNNTNLSNIRVTTKVGVNALLSEDAELKDRGTAILYNLATKEVKTVRLFKNLSLRQLLPKLPGSTTKVFDDVAVELTMAILQFLGGTPPEPQVFRCLKAMHKFCQISGQDVPQLIAMIGPHPSKFKGQSERNDQLIQEISKKVR